MRILHILGLAFCVEVTVDDPKAYKKPWTVRIGWELLPDTDLLDWVCENERDLVHLSGK